MPPTECRPTYRRWRRETALRIGRNEYPRCEISLRIGPNEYPRCEITLRIGRNEYRRRQIALRVGSNEYRRRQIALRIGRADRRRRCEIARGIGSNEYRTCQIALRIASIDHPLRAAPMYPSFPRSLVPGTTTVRRALPSVEVIDPRLAWGTRHAPSHVVSATHPDEGCAWLDRTFARMPEPGKSGGRSGLLLRAEEPPGSFMRRSSVSPLFCLSDRG